MAFHPRVLRGHPVCEGHHLCLLHLILASHASRPRFLINERLSDHSLLVLAVVFGLERRLVKLQCLSNHLVWLVDGLDPVRLMLGRLVETIAEVIKLLICLVQPGSLHRSLGR